MRLTRLQSREYPGNGGDISVAVGGDVIGAQTTQLATDWLWRAGRPADAPTGASATGWTVNFGRFEQNIGALGGGDVTIRAAGDIRDLSVSIPTIGRQEQGTTPAESRVTVIGRGDLDVSAGESIIGGSYFVGGGDARISADSLQATSIAQRDLYPVLALGDGRIEVASRGDLGVAAVLNPMLVKHGRSQAAFPTTYFSTYADESAVSLFSSAGNVTLENNTADLAAVLGASESTRLVPSITFGGAQENDERFALSVYPPSLRSVSYTGDVVVANGMSLWPSSEANLELLAARNVSFFGAAASLTTPSLVMSDADPALLPTPSAPGASLAAVGRALNPAVPLVTDLSLMQSNPFTTTAASPKRTRCA